MKDELLSTQRLEDMPWRRQTSGKKAKASQPQGLPSEQIQKEPQNKREQFKNEEML